MSCHYHLAYDEFIEEKGGHFIISFHWKNEMASPPHLAIGLHSVPNYSSNDDDKFPRSCINQSRYPNIKNNFPQMVVFI